MSKWFPELYSIYKKLDTSESGKSRHYRLYTKKQLVYVVAGGTSLRVCIPFSQHRIITKKGRDYVQITNWYYEKRKLAFDQLLTFEDEQKLYRKTMRTKPLEGFLRGFLSE